MFNFLKSKKPETAASPPPPPARADDGLKDRFRDAVHGVYCRTRTYEFTDATAQQEWLEAHRTGPEQWEIKRRLRVPSPDSASGFAVSQETYLNHNAVTLFRAVEILADYENTQESLARMPCAQPDIKTLGLHYLRAFARREGIVFTTSGRPVPTTEDGRVLENDSFPEEDMFRVLPPAEGPPAKVAVKVKDLPEQSLPVILLNNANAYISPQVQSWQNILTTMQILNNYVREACQMESWGAMNYKDSYRSTAWGTHVFILLKSRKMPDSRLNMEKSLKALGLANEELGRKMMQVYSLFEFHIYLAVTRALKERLSQYVDGTTVNESYINESKILLVTSLCNAGYNRETLSSQLIDALIDKEKSKVYPPQMDEILTWFTGIYEAARAATPGCKSKTPPAPPGPL